MREGWVFRQLPDDARSTLLRALAPLVFTVHRFVERWYHTENRLRLAHIKGSIMWWQLAGSDDQYPNRPNEPQTVEELLDQLYDYADHRKPLK